MPLSDEEGQLARYLGLFLVEAFEHSIPEFYIVSSSTTTVSCNLIVARRAYILPSSTGLLRPDINGGGVSLYEMWVVFHRYIYVLLWCFRSSPTPFHEYTGILHRPVMTGDCLLSYKRLRSQHPLRCVSVVCKARGVGVRGRDLEEGVLSHRHPVLLGIGKSIFYSRKLDLSSVLQLFWRLPRGTECHEGGGRCGDDV